MDIPIHTILKTRRLLLRYPRLDDAAQIFSVVRLPQFPEQLPLKEMNSENEIKKWLKRLQKGWATGQVFSWIVEDLVSGKLIGQMTLSKTGGDNRWAMAFWIHPDHWGKGFATEGAERLLAFGFEVVGAEQIWAGAGDWNKGSYRVMEKIGMVFRRVNPTGYYSKGEPILTREYDISRERWQKIAENNSLLAGFGECKRFSLSGFD